MKTIIALYDQISDANAAIRDVVEYGIGRENISLMANDTTGNYRRYLEGNGGAVAIEPVDSTAAGAATGAGVGAIVGGLGGLLVGLGALVVPGIGPVLAAGPLATAISALTGAGVGAMAGGAAGGLLGALVELGLPEDAAGNYAEGVRRGGILLTVRAEDHQAEDVRRILNRHVAVNLDERVRGWREQGWTGYTANETQQDIDDRNLDYDDRFMNEFDRDFQTDFTTRYPKHTHPYEYYRPAYFFGYELAGDDRYREWSWDELEPRARREWESRGLEGAWEDFKDAVQHAWARVKEAVRVTFD